MESRHLHSAVILSAALGLVISFFAAAEFVDASLRQLCQINSFFSCATVDVSGRTTTLGVPDYLWGIGGFVVILALGLLADRFPFDPRYRWALLGVTTLGVAFAGYFLYVELALIGALCVVCASAYVMGAVSWAASLALVRQGDPVSAPTPPSTRRGRR
ncbi:MAG: vitamin K epoxide reductase family protein [Thermoplasmata archaeon]